VPENLNTILSPSEINTIPRTEDGQIPKTAIVFNGCNSVEALGRSPSGRIYVSSIQT